MAEWLQVVLLMLSLSRHDTLLCNRVVIESKGDFHTMRVCLGRCEIPCSDLNHARTKMRPPLVGQLTRLSRCCPCLLVSWAVPLKNGKRDLSSRFSQSSCWCDRLGFRSARSRTSFFSPSLSWRHSHFSQPAGFSNRSGVRHLLMTSEFSFHRHSLRSRGSR